MVSEFVHAWGMLMIAATAFICAVLILKNHFKKKRLQREAMEEQRKEAIQTVQ